MSKIQNALNKLQSQDKRRRPVTPESKPPESIAEVRESVDVTETDWIGREGQIVEFDREKIQQAGLLAPESLQRQLADQYRLIKRPLLDIARGKAADNSDFSNVIMVTSAMPADGKSFTCINLSLSVATERDTKVLLVDGDVAKPHISHLFGVSEEPGLLDLLADESFDIGDIILRTDVPGLHLLSAGTPNEMATELLASRRMEQVVTSLADTYSNGIVIFDSPPMLSTSEARVLSRHMGQIAVVVAAGLTPQHAVVESLENIDESKAISLILNQATDGIESLIYGERHYGYGYGTNS